MTSDILTQLKLAVSDRYEVRRELARGGMGHVFEARDLKHGRAVAIKVLDPELAVTIGPQRFRTEIETAARLSHPHIVPLFDSGHSGSLFYFVMPLVSGESLRERLNRERQLPIEDALRIAREVADALRYAHEQGLIHRDVKPENILLTGGHALVLDFGIARSTDAGESVPTRTTVSVGTPAYMSPEQIAGAVLDGRSDQYALACVVYEALAGQPPFTGPSADNVISQHQVAAPRPINSLRPTTPPPVAAALARGLSKAPADRFRTLSDFSDALSAASAPAAHGRASGRPSGPGQDRVMLAVLPLDNLSADPEQEYFTEGMTEELIAHLGRVQPKRLGVIARTSAMQYKKTKKSVGVIGQELGVEYVLEGSVRRSGDRIRITTQLIQVSDQSHLWAETYDRRMADVFELQDEVAATVAKALELELVPAAKGHGAAPEVVLAASRASEQPAANSAAYEAYLKGRFYWNKRVPEALLQAIAWFKRAIEADPGFARAYSGLSDVYDVTLTYMVVPGDEAMRQSEAAARRALELEPDLADAHTSLASVLGHLGHQGDAVASLRRALDLDPNYVPALYWGAIILIIQGDLDGAIALVDRAHVLDPVSVAVNIVHGNVLFFSGREEEALPYFQEAVSLHPAFPWPYQRIAICHAALGHLDEGLNFLNGLLTDLRRTLGVVAARAYILGKLGRLDEARGDLRELEERSKSEYVSWERFAYAYLGLDDRDSLLALLSGVKVLGSLGRLSLRHEKAFDSVRNDPRFAKIFENAGRNEVRR